jgi:MtN3 and saliva related transmembrane protein
MSNNQADNKINPKLIESIGYLGSLLSCITFVPQVYLSWKSHSVGDLSLIMVLIVNFSCIVWLTYAYLIKSRPVLIANTIVLILSLMLLYFKLTF